MAYTSNDGHSLASEMHEVHQQMSTEYELETKAGPDAIRAQRMEMWLRTFKAAGDKWYQNSTKPSFQTRLEEQVFEQIAARVDTAMNLTKSGQNSLFRWRHAAGLSRQKDWGVDDIFEKELAVLLEEVAKFAIENNVNNQNINTGVSTIGQITGTINQELMQRLENGKLQDIVNLSSNRQSQLIGPIQAKAIKVDVTGYNSQFALQANIKPEWREFINLFTGVRMSVKNYSSNTKYTTIHLGNTVLKKAIPATLMDIGYNIDETEHIYFHLINTRSEKKEQQHALHLRFAYELTGGGLVDAETQEPLDSVDFFVYNDPVSSNIYVRSTKEMISQAMKYMGEVSDPLYSDIVILKDSFS